MGEIIRKPTGDATVQWNIQPGTPPTHYDKIDEAWSVANTSDYIHETVNAQSDYIRFYTPGTATNTVHTVHVDFYINTTNVGQLPGLGVNLYYGGTYVTHRNYDIDTGGAWWKRRATFTGLSLTPAQFNLLRVRFATRAGSGVGPYPEVVE